MPAAHDEIKGGGDGNAQPVRQGFQTLHRSSLRGALLLGGRLHSVDRVPKVAQWSSDLIATALRGVTSSGESKPRMSNQLYQLRQSLRLAPLVIEAMLKAHHVRTVILAPRTKMCFFVNSKHTS